MKNRVRPDSQLFNSCGCNSWAKGMGCPLPSQLEGLGAHHKLPCRVWGRALAEKQVLQYLELEKTPDFTSPDFSLTFSIFSDLSLSTFEFRDFSRFSR